MGRTFRNRKKAGRGFRRLDHEPELVSLNSWLAQHGTDWNRKLGYADFEGVGRGLVANRALHPGELLVDLPLSLTINITTVLLDRQFTDIFTNFGAEHHTLSLQSLLAFYLVSLKTRPSLSKWHVYLKSLPTEYTLPYFLSDNLKRNLESGIRNIVRKQEDAVRQSFKILTDIIRNSTDESSLTKLLKEKFTLRDYEWAYFTVNTRCVYMDLSDIFDLTSLHSPILLLLKDAATIALCPYLDMINHSSKVKSKTELVLKVAGASAVPLKDLREDALSSIRFHLYTMDCVMPYREVYICYGDSHNLKLVTEYGFYLPSNELDSVNFEFETIHNYLTSLNFKLSQEQCSFITSHNLCKGLYVDNSGLSFNLYALLTVLKLYNNHRSDISKIIYSPVEAGSGRSNLSDLIMPLVTERISEIEECIANVSNVNDSVNLSNCVNLMQRYVDILKSLGK